LDLNLSKNWKSAKFGAVTWTLWKVDHKYLEYFEMDGEDHLNHRVRNEVLHTVDEDRHIVYKTKRRKTEGKIEGKIEVTGK
jgi:hypothetical protein